MAVDYGTRRVGLALADPLRLFAQPFGTFSPDKSIEQLQAVHAREGLETIVVGWPLTEQGCEGIATDRVQRYCKWLQRALPGVAIQKWDERFTTEEAKDRLAQQGRPFDRARVDTAAAGIILQEYLDHLKQWTA